MFRRFAAFLLVCSAAVLAVQSVVKIQDAARAHVRCALHGEMLHLDGESPSDATATEDRSHGAELRSAPDVEAHHGCDLAGVVVPGATPLPRVPDLPTLRWVLAPAPARAPPTVPTLALAPLSRAPKTSPPLA